MNLQSAIQGRRKYCRSKIHDLASAENTWFGFFLFFVACFLSVFFIPQRIQKIYGLASAENTVMRKYMVWPPFHIFSASRYNNEQPGSNARIRSQLRLVATAAADEAKTGPHTVAAAAPRQDGQTTDPNYQ